MKTSLRILIICVISTQWSLCQANAIPTYKDAFFIAKNSDIIKLYLEISKAPLIESELSNSSKITSKHLDSLLNQGNNNQITNISFQSIRSMIEEIVGIVASLDTMKIYLSTIIANNEKIINNFLTVYKSQTYDAQYIILDNKFNTINSDHKWMLNFGVSETKSILINDKNAEELDSIVKPVYESYFPSDDSKMFKLVTDNSHIELLEKYKLLYNGLEKQVFEDEIKAHLKRQNDFYTEILNNLIFIKSLIKEEDIKRISEVKIINTISTPFFNSEISSSFSGLSDFQIPQYKIPTQSDMVDALAILIANRFKEEVALTFVDKLRNQIANDTLLTILFPRTQKLFDATDIYINPSFGSGWKEAFAQDFASIQISLKEYIRKYCGEQNKLQGIFNREMACNYAQVVDILLELRNGTSFFDLIDYTIDRELVKDELLQCFQLIRFFKDNLLVYEEGRYFATFSDFRDLTPLGKNIFDLYFTETYKQIFNKANPKDINKIMEALPKIILQFQRLESVLQEIKKTEKNGLSGLYQYWDAIEDLVLEVSQLFPDSLKTKIKEKVDLVNTAFDIQKTLEVKNYGAMIHNVFKLLELLVNKNAAVAKTDFELLLMKKYALKPEMKDFVEIYRKIDLIAVDSNFRKSTKNCEKFEKFAEFSEHYDCFRTNIIKDTNLLAFLEDSKIDSSKFKSFLECKVLGNSKKDGRLFELFKFYIYQKFYKLPDDDYKYMQMNNGIALNHVLNTLNFVVDVLTINSSKDLSRLITTKSAPVSSYKIKRHNRFSIDINAYPMLYVALETTRYRLFNPNQNPEFQQNAYSNGFSCPIGISFSLGLSTSGIHPKDNPLGTFRRKNGNYSTLRGNAFTFTFTMIDLGAPVAYRIANGDDGELPEQVKFEQFLSPGTYFSIGIRRTPLVLIGGAQFTPKLRTFNAGIENPEFIGALRFSLGIAMDIPLFNAYRFTKRQRQIYSNL